MQINHLLATPKLAGNMLAVVFERCERCLCRSSACYQLVQLCDCLSLQCYELLQFATLELGKCQSLAVEDNLGIVFDKMRGNFFLAPI